MASAIALDLTLFAMVMCELAYIRITKVYERTWGGWSSECVLEWWPFVKLAIPGLFMVALEEWGFEIVTLLSGILGEVELGAQSIIFQLEALCFMVLAFSLKNNKYSHKQ